MAVLELEREQRVVTYEDYIREVAEGIEDPCEIVDGVRQPMIAPNYPHQRYSRRLTVLIESYMEQHGGEGGAAPTDLMIREEPLTVREPDLFYASEATLEKYGELPEIGSIKFPVDLVVEILSPSERRGDIEGKLRDYAPIGVCECWVVSPEAQDVTVLTLHEGTYRKANVYSPGELLVSATLPGLGVDIDKLFAPRKRLSAEGEVDGGNA